MRPEDQQQPEPSIPDRLAADLRRLTDVKAGAPEVFEAELLSLARRRFSRSNRLQLHLRRTARRTLPLAAAAGLAVTAWVGFRIVNSPSSTPMPRVDPAPLLAMDFDASGRVDILDAFLIARAIESGSPLPGAWDVTDDHIIDRRDADAIAAVAVSLTESSSS